MVYVKELDLFVTVMLLEETPTVLSLGKLSEDHGYTYHWTGGQKPHLTKNGKKTNCNRSNHVPFVVPGLSKSSSKSSTPSQNSVTDTENPTTERSGSTSGELRENPLHRSSETENTNKNEGHAKVQILHEVPDWLQEFR